MNGKVTARSIAYIIILIQTNVFLSQIHLSLTNAPTWTDEYYSLSYPQMYNFIVDFFEGPRLGTQARQRADDLLAWWNRMIFPVHASSAATNRTALTSINKLCAQRAAMEC
ncbi:hypothetical protein B0H10DRAFT_1959014 [Mycena sp. CBHHK59/15]|nr:hypothetical protein B0H10DRAFT_1959014 [Mycena sp. CBHHK59/15]